MSRDRAKLDFIKESKEQKPLDRDVEMLFIPVDPKNNKPDVHMITNERRAADEQSRLNPTQPLLEPDRGRQKPPLAGPEIDDLDDEKPVSNGRYPGIDDGLLEPGEKDPDPNDDEDRSEHPPTQDDGVNTDEGKWLPIPGQDVPDYPLYDGGLSPRFGVDDRPGSPIPGVIPDVNTYQQKKNLAQGMMDLALFSANANQLRFVIETANGHPYYYFSLTFISLSLILQVAVGVGLILNSRYNVKDEKDICKADKINNMTVLGVFLITVVNVFIASFSVAPTSTGVVTVPSQVSQPSG